MYMYPANLSLIVIRNFKEVWYEHGFSIVHARAYFIPNEISINGEVRCAILGQIMTFQKDVDTIDL